MNTFTSRAASAFALVTLATLLGTVPAHAMGRSGSQSSKPQSGVQTPEREGWAGAGVQIQIDALRKEIAELKARMANSVAAK